MLAALLLAGSGLRNMSDGTLEIHTNEALIARQGVLLLRVKKK
jgi:hypothetical protein